MTYRIKGQPRLAYQRSCDAAFRLALRILYPLARFWWFLSRPWVRGVYVMVWRLDEAGRRHELLLARNAYKGGYTVPGGGVAKTESTIDAARRELVEEVGLNLPEARLQQSDDFKITYMHRSDHVTFFDVEIAHDEPVTIEIDNREVVWARFVQFPGLDPAELVPPLRHFLMKRSFETG